MASIIKLIDKNGTSKKAFSDFFQEFDRFINTHGYTKICDLCYFTELIISPTVLRTIISTIKNIPTYKQVIKHIYYSNNLAKI